MEFVIKENSAMNQQEANTQEVVVEDLTVSEPEASEVKGGSDSLKYNFGGIEGAASAARGDSRSDLQPK